MADIKDLIGAIVNKDALAVKEIFSSVMAEKIGERMDALRPLVADAMFNEGKMKCEECGYGMAKEDSNCKKCGCSMNEAYDWDSLVEEEINESDDNVKDDAPDTVAKDHPLVQLKKILDTKGGAFRTSTGKTVNVDHASAKRLLALHNATQKSEVKQRFASAVHRDPIGTHDKFFPKAKIGEETELNELRRSTLGSYATKAMSRGDIASRMSKSDDDAMGKIANKRFAGVKLAARKIATSAGAGRATATDVGKNVDKARAAGMGASTGSNKDREDYGKSYNAAQRGISKLRNMGEETELDELSQDTLKSYIKKSSSDAKMLGYRAGSKDGQRMTGGGPGQRDDDKAHRRLSGVRRAVDKLAEAGMREEELDELSQDTLVSYGQKAREAGGRTKGSALAVKKILAARGKSTGVKVPASEETE